jgi:hypothetical protein
MTKKSSHQTIKVREEIYTMIEELRTQFGQMTNNPDLTDEDVLAVLINGFIESVERDSVEQPTGGCCGGQGESCDCDKEACGCA